MTPSSPALHRAPRAAPSAEALANDLSRAIHEHRIAPGLKLGEGDLAEIYGVSRTVVRAALQALSHIQLVDIHHNRGAFVAKPSLIEAQEVFEARELLEPRTARSAALIAQPRDLDRLRAHIDTENAALAEGNHGQALRLSGQFHTEIARIAGHSTIGAFIETLIARSSLIIALYWRLESALCECHAHDALTHAIGAGDAARAEDLMRSHLVDLHSALVLRAQTVAPRFSERGFDEVTPA